MTKIEIRKIARIYAANTVYNLAGAFGSYSELLTEDENKLLSEEIILIADKMTHVRLNFGELGQIIKYVAVAK
jgi:hypothetical protein